MTQQPDPKETPVHRLPILPTRKEVILPGAVVPLEVGRRASIAAVDAAVADGGAVLLVPQRDPRTDQPGPASLFDVGVRCEIVQIGRHSSTRYTVMIRAIARVHVDRTETVAPGYLRAEFSPVATVVPPDTEEATRLVESARELLSDILAEQSDTTPDKVREGLAEVEDADELVDMAAAHLELERAELLALLGEADVVARLRLVLPPLERLAQVLRIKGDIREQLVEELSKEEREKVLRQRMKAINEQLGESDDEQELGDFLDRLDESKMPDEVRKVARKQIAKMRQAGESSPEHSIARTYLELLLDLPWGKTTQDTLDVPAARAILEADHAGLEKVKKRILEFIAVRKLAPGKHGPILCLAGPPGVGKTSLGRSIAAALGRKYVRASLGGVHDDSEIRGHRRTYIGALPGRIVAGLKKAGTMNPVFVLDEIDKLSSSMRGDPASALLEVLDPEQNAEFVDHYLEVPLDLSQVMFIATANDVDTIPAPLLDRMEVIQLPGYTDREKLAIARRHLLPKQLAEHGIEKDQLVLPDGTLREVIQYYTREAGVRNLEREIGTLCRHAAVALAGGAAGPITIEAGEVAAILGPPRFFSEVADQVAGVGVATGLGWMPTGGDLIFIESRNMPGKGDVKLTGQVGDVMDESARTALSWVRSHAEELGIEPGRFAETDLHVHVPAGAVRKDGPSAGVAMATALVSLFSGRPVRPDVAMTGEVTLRGLVLPVGGIKGKVLAAHRAGIHTVLLPARNREDLADVPEEVRRELDIRFVSKVGEALEIALGEPGDRAGALDAPPSPQQPGPATRPGGDQRPARVAEA